MSYTREQLLDLYSSGDSIEEIQASRAYQNLCRDNDGDRTFYTQRKLFETIRSSIDVLLKDCASHRLQIRCALRHRRELNTEEEKDLFRTLVLRIYARNWSHPARAYYEQTSQLMIRAWDYFLSFTARNALHPNQNEVNYNHRHFIRSSLGGKIYDRADKSRRNLLAETVDYHLKNCYISGFFYQHYLENNEDVVAKLTHGCQNSLSFVQLVQTSMFRPFRDSRNWCFFEYDLTYKQDPKRILFVQIEDDVPKNGVHSPFKAWYDDFAAKDSIKITETRTRSQTVIDENRRKIRELLLTQINEVEEQIYSAIPD